MKKFVTIICALLLSIVGMGQTDWTDVVSPEIVVNPMDWVCDSLQWDEVAPGQECVANANYYVVNINVEDGQVLNSITFSITENNTFNTDEGKYYMSFADYDPGRHPTNDTWSNTQLTTPGISLVNNNTSEVLLYISRIELAEDYLPEDVVYFNTPLTEGSYTLYVLNESTFSEAPNINSFMDVGGDGTWGSGDALCFPNWPDFCLFEIAGTNTYYTNNPQLIKLEGQDFVISDISLDYSATVPSLPDFDATYDACDGVPFELSSTCLEGPQADEITFQWEYNIQAGEFDTWFTLPNDTTCTFTRVFEYDTASVDAVNNYEYRFIRHFTFAESDTTYFGVDVNPTPDWGYEVNIVSFTELENLLVFDLYIPLDSMNFADSDINGDFVWDTNDDFDGAPLLIEEVYGGGFGCGWLCNPFETDGDSLASYVVSVELFNGCAASDTTYIVFQDTDGSGSWTPVDSLDVRNYLIILGDTTETDTSTFVTELLQRNIRLYPNPTNGLTTIEHNFAVGSTLEIYGLTGALVRREQVTQEKFVTDLADLQKGIYLVTIFDEQDRFTLRLVKQ